MNESEQSEGVHNISDSNNAISRPLKSLSQVNKNLQNLLTRFAMIPRNYL